MFWRSVIIFRALPEREKRIGACEGRSWQITKLALRCPDVRACELFGRMVSVELLYTQNKISTFICGEAGADAHFSAAQAPCVAL